MVYFLAIFDLDDKIYTSILHRRIKLKLSKLVPSNFMEQWMNISFFHAMLSGLMCSKLTADGPKSA